MIFPDLSLVHSLHMYLRLFSLVVILHFASNNLFLSRLSNLIDNLCTLLVMRDLLCTLLLLQLQNLLLNILQLSVFLLNTLQGRNTMTDSSRKGFNITRQASDKSIKFVLDQTGWLRIRNNDRSSGSSVKLLLYNSKLLASSPG